MNLHLCDNVGVPTYAVVNGFYHLQKSGVEVMQSYLRATDEQTEILKTAS